MGAKRSAEMKEALRLHGQGMNAHRAAKRAGVLPSSFYRLLNERRLKLLESLGVGERPVKR